MNEFKNIAIMTSGGDAPGMNAAIRSVVRSAASFQVSVVAVHNGYEGLIDKDFSPISVGEVSNIIHRGGTIIKTSRSARFKEQKWRKVAFQNLKSANVNGLIIIGGNGSFSGASVFTSEFNMPVVGIPKTIDNDIYGTDHCIGFDTAVNTAVEAIDKIRDTADSHHRIFLVEIMGRDRGFLALSVGLAAGAEFILLPENPNNPEDLISGLQKGWDRKKNSIIAVVAEGAHNGGVQDLADKIRSSSMDLDVRCNVLGYIQRGGSPSAFDRIIASQYGYCAVEALLKGNRNCIVGLQQNVLTYTSLHSVANAKPQLNSELAFLSQILSR